MTSEQFHSLSVEQQELFINKGGTIDNFPVQSIDAQSEVISHSVNGPGNGQAAPSNSSGALPVTESPGSNCDSQPAHINLHPEYSDGFDIKDPVELLFLLDDEIARGIAKGGADLHPWQVKFMLDFASMMHDKDRPFKAAVQACNGSGKDKYIVAACVVWLCMRFKKARGVVTNGSGDQLDNQTEVYVNQLCEAANRKFAGGKEEIWKCNYRYYECIPTNSPIKLFATDEPNKAEGYHPLAPGSKMAIFTSESKSIPDTIFTALGRCTGFTHRVDVSTPGLPMGYFFDRCMGAVPRDTLTDIKSLRPEQTVLYKVTSYDCPHITASEIEQIADGLPKGKNDPVFKSAVLSEFGTTDEMVVIPYTYIWRAFTNTEQYPQPKYNPEAHNQAGLDLSDGGDETVLIVRNGNKHIITLPFRFDNTEDTVEYLNEKFKEHELTNPESHINADCGGLGKPILDRLRRMGWSNIRYIDNRNTAYYPKTYLNRGTELWFHVRKLFERHEIILSKDDRLVRQLSTRYYKIDQNNKHRLLSKIESRSRGYPSPDRADAFVLCFWNFKSTFTEPIPKTDDDRPFKLPVDNKPKHDFSLKQWALGSDTPVQRLGKKPRDMSILMEQIEQHNKLVKQKATEKEQL